MKPRRLLTLGHSYAVALNRRLADEMARARPDSWRVEAAAPAFLHGDLRPIPFEPGPEGSAPTTAVPAYLTRKAHLTAYGRTLRGMLRGGGYDLVHAWVEPYVFAGHQVSRWAGDSPVVYYTFQNIAKRYPPPFAQLERGVMRRAAGCLYAGHTVEAVARQKPMYQRLPGRVVPLGVDCAAFRPDPAARAAVLRELGWPESGAPVVGYLGRFTPEKGLGLLRRALGAVKSPWRLLLVGGGPMLAELQAWAEAEPARVAVATGVPHGAVPRYVAAFDLLAAPSQTTPQWKEQLGRMLIEAFACGVPVVGSDSGEIPFVVGDAGFVVPEADESAWADTLGRLLESPDLRAESGRRGRERAESVYAWPVVARQTLAFFDEVLDRRAAS